VTGVKLYEAGYQDLVLVRPKSKKPAKHGWLDQTPDLDEIKQWGGNFGLIGGWYPAIDLDLFDAGFAKEIVRLTTLCLGAAPCRTSHRAASRLLVYRTELPFPKKVLTLPEGQGKIEVLGQGRQYLVSGTHPEGTEYGWMRKSLWDIPAQDLTLVTEEQIDKYLTDMQNRFGGTIYSGRAAVGEVNVEELRAPSPEMVVGALRVIPNRDDFLQEVFPHGDPRDAWISFAHAVYGAAGEVVVDEFVAWTQRYEDGEVDPDLARQGYLSCEGTYTGWPTLHRILAVAQTELIPPEEDFADEVLGENPNPLPEYPDSVQFSEEYVVDRILPDMAQQIIWVAGAWRYWDGSTWVEDEGLVHQMRVRTRLREFALDLINMAAQAPDPGWRKRLEAFARKLQSRAGIASVVDLCRGPLSRKVEEFDQDTMALNTPGGLVDLRTGLMRVTTPEDLVSRCTAVAPAPSYDPERAPHWQSFLAHLTRGDHALVSFLKRYMGYALTGEMGEKKLIFVWGSNSNTGKSTFVNACTHAVGSYARSVDVDAFMGVRSTTDSLAQLPGVRLATATEASAGQKWDDKIIKAITGGDAIEARRLYQSFFTFRPQFKLMIAGNHRPSLKSVDQAMLKRVLIVPMNHRVIEPDPTLGKKLEAEAAQILRWMIDGAVEWTQQGLAPPEAVQAATDEYADEENAVAQWLSECCDFQPELRVTTQELYTSWGEWNRARGVNRIEAAIGFSRMLNAHFDAEQDLGVTRFRSKAQRGYIGVTLKPRVVLGTDDF
jgi:putative DNA primase/helicase